MQVWWWWWQCSLPDWEFQSGTSPPGGQIELDLEGAGKPAPETWQHAHNGYYLIYRIAQRTVSWEGGMGQREGGGVAWWGGVEEMSDPSPSHCHFPQPSLHCAEAYIHVPCCHVMHAMQHAFLGQRGIDCITFPLQRVLEHKRFMRE